jgi:hypothetical protein
MRISVGELERCDVRDFVGRFTIQHTGLFLATAVHRHEWLRHAKVRALRVAPGIFRTLLDA